MAWPKCAACGLLFFCALQALAAFAQSDDCDDGNPCTLNAVVDGVCLPPRPAADGTPCDNLDECSGGDTCQGGVCENSVLCKDLAIVADNPSSAGVIGWKDGTVTMSARLDPAANASAARMRVGCFVQPLGRTRLVPVTPVKRARLGRVSPQASFTLRLTKGGKKLLRTVGAGQETTDVLGVVELGVRPAAGPNIRLRRTSHLRYKVPTF